MSWLNSSGLEKKLSSQLKEDLIRKIGVGWGGGGGGGISVTPVIFPSLIDLVTNSVSVIRDSCSVQTVFYVVLCRYVSD